MIAPGDGPPPRAASARIAELERKLTASNAEVEEWRIVRQAMAQREEIIEEQLAANATLRQQLAVANAEVERLQGQFNTVVEQARVAVATGNRLVDERDALRAKLARLWEVPEDLMLATAHRLTVALRCRSHGRFNNCSVGLKCGWAGRCNLASTEREKAAAQAVVAPIRAQAEGEIAGYEAAARSLKADNEWLRERLRKAGAQFRHYERLHAAKPDMEKAATNAESAEMCESAIRRGDAP